MADLPQFTWPVQFETRPDGTVAFAELEQGTPAELMASAAVLAATPRGRRHDDPAFGISELVFQQGAIDTDRLAAELRQGDDRLELDVDELLDITNATRRTVNARLSS